MRRLPPLRALEAFVRTARTGSAKLAAAELALSAPALSRRIKALEDYMAHPLFERRAQHMVLNAHGRALLDAIGPALEQLTDAIEGLAGRNGEQRLRLGVMPLFGTQRLIPRLPELRRQHPHLHIDVDTQAHAETQLGETIDAAIVIADTVDPRLYSIRLDRNHIYAIASRRLAESGAITTPADLARQTILVHSEMGAILPTFLAAMGVPRLKPAAVDHLDSGQLILEAAAQGLGVAIMHGGHLTDARDDRLVRLFDAAVESPYSYWFICRPKALDQRPVRLFHDWLIAALV